MSAARPEVRAFFHKATWTMTYVVADPTAKRAAIVDPALDYDPASGRTGTLAADEVVAFVRERGWAVDWILETHAHADHLSAAQHLKRALGGKVAIGQGITAVQGTFVKVFGLEGEVAADGSQFDHLFRDGERFKVGGIGAEVLHTPGHTDDSVTYLIGDAAFIGDTMFMPDGGTARCDFPGGDARRLYRSIQRILALPPATRLFMCHDYQPGGRELRYETTIAAQRAENLHLRGDGQAGTSEDEFVRMREARDATLGMPNLIVQSIQVNIRAGRLPEPDAQGRRFLKTPLDLLGKPLARK
jgi:glyoxylase-like metal-dependent hydrolase (beta-lactamase superfamily II)